MNTLTTLAPPISQVSNGVDEHSEQTYQALLEAYEQAGGIAAVLQSPYLASLIMNGEQVLEMHSVPGVHLTVERQRIGVAVHISVDPYTVVDQPLYLCLGMLDAEGVQYITTRYDIGAHARVAALVYWLFPHAQKVDHIADSSMHIGPDATLIYTETHYHGSTGGIRAVPQIQIHVAERGQYVGTFSLNQGNAGHFKLEYHANVGNQGLVNLTTRIYGTDHDDIRVQKNVHLNGSGARGMLNTHIAARDHAHSRVYTTMVGHAAGACGHIDCTSIIHGQAMAENVPRVVIHHSQARITQTATVGRVNQCELERLVAQGLDADTALDMLIQEMLA